MAHGKPEGEEELMQTHPGYATYKQCQTSVFKLGTLSIIVGTTITFCGLVGFNKFVGRLPIHIIAAVSPAVGIALGYKVSKDRSKECRDIWLALEGRNVGDEN